MWFIRPLYKAESKKTTTKPKSNQSATKENKKKKPAAKKKAQKLTISNNTINYNMANRGYKPKGIVIHNDAGGSTGKQYENSLANAGYNRFVNGIAHAYASEGYVWQAIPDGKVAWHTGDGVSAGTGNHEMFGIEACQSMSASDAQFLKNEQATFQFVAKKLKEWGLPANRNTIRLHMEYVPTACPHRSMKMHTGFDPVKQGRPSNAIMIKLKDYFIKQVRSYMDGKIPTSTVSNKTSSSSNTASTVAGSWKKNSYGTYYMSESARFTCGNSPIAVRTIGPFRSCPLAYWFQPGGYCDYDEVMVQDGLVWLGYTWKGVRYYLPIREVTGVPPNHKVSSLWGTVS